MPELRFDNVKKNYGDKQALRGVSFTLKEGIYGLLGPNGAGVAVRLIADAPPPYPSHNVEPTLEDVYLHTFGDEGGL